MVQFLTSPPFKANLFQKQNNLLKRNMSRSVTCSWYHKGCHVPRLAKFVCNEFGRVQFPHDPPSVCGVLVAYMFWIHVDEERNLASRPYGYDKMVDMLVLETKACRFKFYYPYQGSMAERFIALYC